MLAVGKNKLYKSLEKDDYVDYIVLVALVLIAVFGLGMWHKLKE
jgi:hypothetical protein